MVTEGELSLCEDSDRVRELQDRVGDLKAEVEHLRYPFSDWHKNISFFF